MRHAYCRGDNAGWYSVGEFIAHPNPQVSLSSRIDGRTAAKRGSSYYGRSRYYSSKGPA